MKPENKDKCFFAGIIIAMVIVLLLTFYTIKEMPTTTTFGPMYEMYPLGPI